MSKESFIDQIKPQETKAVEKKKVTLYLDSNTVLSMKIKSAKKGKTQSQFIEELIKTAKE